MNEQRLCKRCNTEKPLTEKHFHWEKGFRKICRACLDKQRNKMDERKTIELEQKEKLRQRVRFFEECLKYYETGNDQYYNDEVISFEGGRDKINANTCTRYFKAHLQWMKQHLDNQ